MSDKEHSEAEPLIGPVLPWLWIVLSCLLAGMIGELGGYNTLWGSGSRFFEFAFPLWLSFGSMHIPGLVVGFSALQLLRRSSHSTLILLRCLFAGVLIAGLVADFDEKRLDLGGSPPWMFLMVDGATLFIFSFVYVKPRLDGKGRPALHLLGALLLPGLLIAGIRVGAVLTDDRHAYDIWTSDWSDEAGLELFWLVLRESDRGLITAEECARLASVAADPYRTIVAYHEDWPARHRVIHLYRERQKMWQKNPTEADFRYEWWPDGRGACHVLGRDYEFKKGVRGANPANYLWPDGRE